MAKKDYFHKIGFEVDMASLNKAAKQMEGTFNKAVAETTSEVESLISALKNGKDINLDKLAQTMANLATQTSGTNGNYEMLKHQISDLEGKFKTLDESIQKANSSTTYLQSQIKKFKTDMETSIGSLQTNITNMANQIRDKIQIKAQVELIPGINTNTWIKGINGLIKEKIQPALNAVEIDITPKKAEKLDAEIEKIKNVKLGASEGDTIEADIEKLKNRFKVIRQTITDERKGLDDEVKKWRQSINKNLDLEFKFKGLGDRALRNLSSDLIEVIDEVNGELVNHPIVLQTNIKDLAKKIEDRLNKIKIDNITVGDIQATGKLNIDGPATLTGGTVVGGGAAPLTPAIMSKESVERLADTIANSINGVKKGTGSTVPKEAPSQKSSRKKEKQEENKIFAGYVADLYKKLSGNLDNATGNGQKNSIQKNFPEMHKALQALVANPNDKTLMDVLESSDFANFAKEWGNPKSLIPIIAQAISRSRSETDSLANTAQDKADIANINKAYASAVKKDNFKITPETSPNLHRAITLLHEFASTDKTFSQKMDALTKFAVGLDDTQIATEGSRSAQIFESMRGLMADIAAFTENQTVISQVVKDKAGNIVKDEKGKEVYEDVKLVDSLRKSSDFRDVISMLSSIDTGNITKDTIKSLMSIKNIGSFFNQYGDYITRTTVDQNGNRSTSSSINAVFDDSKLAQAVYNVLFRETDLSGEIAPLFTGASKNKFDFTQEMLRLREDLVSALGKDYNTEGVASARAAGASAKEIMNWMYEYAKILKHISQLHNTRRNPDRLSFESVEAQSEWISQQKVSKNDLNKMIDSMTSDGALKIKDMQAELAKKQEKIDAYNTSIIASEKGLKRFKESEKDSDAYRKQAAILAKDVQARDALTKEYQALEVKIEEAREPERNAILKLLGMTEANVVDVKDAKMSQVLTPILGTIADYKRQMPAVNELKDKLAPSMKEALAQEGDYNTNLANLLVEEILKATKVNTTQGKQVRSIFKENGVNAAMFKRLQDKNLEAEEQWKILENGIFNNTNVDFNKLISDLNAGSAALKKGYPRFISLLQYAQRYSDVVWKTDSSHLSALGRIDNAVKTVRFGELETKDKAITRKVEYKQSDVVQGQLKHAQEIADIKTPAYELMLKQEELLAERTKAQLDYMERNKTSMVDIKDQRLIFEDMAETQSLGADYRSRIQEAIQLFDSGKTIDRLVIDAKEKHLQSSNALVQAETSLLNAISNEEDKAIAKAHIDGEMLNAKQQQRFDSLVLPEKEQYKAALKSSNDTAAQLDVVQKMKDAVSIDSIKELYAQQKNSIQAIKQQILAFTDDVRRLEQELAAALADEAANPDRKYSYLVDEDITQKRRQGGFDKIAAGYQFVVTDEKGHSLKVGDWHGAEGADKTINDGGFQYNAVLKELPKWIEKELTAGFSSATAKALGMPTYVNTAVEPPERYKKQYVTKEVSTIDNRIAKAENELNNLTANVDAVVEDLVRQIVHKIQIESSKSANIDKKVEGTFSVLNQEQAKTELQSQLILAKSKAESAKTDTIVQAQLLENRKAFAIANPKMQLPDYEVFIEQNISTISNALKAVWSDAEAYSKSVLSQHNEIAELEKKLNQVAVTKSEILNKQAQEEATLKKIAQEDGVESSKYRAQIKLLQELYQRGNEITAQEQGLKERRDNIANNPGLKSINEIRTQDKVIADAIRSFIENLDRESYEIIKQTQQKVTADPKDAVTAAQKDYDAAVVREQNAKAHVEDITNKLAEAEQKLTETRQKTHERLMATQTSTSSQITNDERKVVDIAAQLASAKQAHKDALSVVAKSDKEAVIKETNITAAKEKVDALQKELRELIKATTGLTDEKMLAQAQAVLNNQKANLTQFIKASQTEKEKLLAGLTKDSNISSLRSRKQLADRYFAYYSQQDNALSDRLSKQQVEYDDAKEDPNVTKAYLDQLNVQIRATEEERRVVREEKAWMKEQQKAISNLLEAETQKLRDKYNAPISTKKVDEPIVEKGKTQDSVDDDTTETTSSSNVKDLLIQALTGMGITGGKLMLAGLPEDIATETTLRQVLHALTEPYNKEVIDIEEQLQAERAKLVTLDNKNKTLPAPLSGGATPPTVANKKTAGEAKSDAVENELTKVKAQTVQELRNRLNKDKSLTEQQKNAINEAIRLIQEENTLSTKIINAEKARLAADNNLMSIGKKHKGISGAAKNAYVKQALGEKLTAEEQKKISNISSVDKKVAAEAYGQAGAEVSRSIAEYVNSVIGKAAKEVKNTESKSQEKTASQQIAKIDLETQKAILEEKLKDKRLGDVKRAAIQKAIEAINDGISVEKQLSNAKGNLTKTTNELNTQKNKLQETKMHKDTQNLVLRKIRGEKLTGDELAKYNSLQNPLVGKLERVAQDKSDKALNVSNLQWMKGIIAKGVDKRSDENSAKNAARLDSIAQRAESIVTKLDSVLSNPNVPDDLKKQLAIVSSGAQDVQNAAIDEKAGLISSKVEIAPEDITKAIDIAETQADTTIITKPEIPAGEVAQEITEAEQRGETVADLVPEAPIAPVSATTADVPEAVDERTQILNTIAQLEQKLADAKSQGGYLATEAKQDAIIEILKGGLKVDGTTAKGEGSGNRKQKDDNGDKVKYTLQADNVTKRKATIDARMKNLYGDNIIQQKTDSMSEAWDEYNKRYDAFLENERKAFANGKKITEQEKQNLINEQAELTVVENQLKKQISRAEKLKVTEIDRIDYNKNDNIDMQTQMKWFAGIDDSAEYQWKFNKETQTATYVIEGANNSIREMTISYDALSQSLVKGEKKQIASFSNMEKFIQGIKSKWVEVARYMASFASLYRVFGEMRKGVQYVRDIDKALTELKKVTDATDATYDKFLKNMSKTAGVIGSTTSQLTTMAAEWARLGYSIEEAGQLAESTAILLNVSEFSDATQASEALISTMQAFQYTADESQHVVDVLNEVGKFIARR